MFREFLKCSYGICCPGYFEDVKQLQEGWILTTLKEIHYS